MYICAFQCAVGFWLMRSSSSVLWTFLGFGEVGIVHLKCCLGALCCCGVGLRKFVVCEVDGCSLGVNLSFALYIVST